MNINQQIAIKGAELLGLNFYVLDDSVEVLHKSGLATQCSFDPVNNGTDMNKLIEALKINVSYDYSDDTWKAKTENMNMLFSAASRDEAIRQCVIKALGIGFDND